MIGALYSCLAEADGLDEKSLNLRGFPYRKQRAEKAVDGLARSDLRCCPSLARVAAVFHQFVTETGRMAEADEPLAEALLDRILIHAVTLQMILPEWERSFR